MFEAKAKALRPRPVVFKAKASIFETKAKASDHDC